LTSWRHRLGWWLEDDHHAPASATRAREPAFQPGEREIAPARPDERVQVQFHAANTRPDVRAIIDHAAAASSRDPPAVRERVNASPRVSTSIA
jgi:hypothetical protein